MAGQTNVNIPPVSNFTDTSPQLDTPGICRRIEALKAYGMQQTELHRLRMLLERLGNPQDAVPCVHVAGTNGKGSTCTLAANALSAGGYRTGLFTSPYLMDFRESMVIDGAMMNDADFTMIGDAVLRQIELLQASGVIISEFECNFAMAMLWFARKGCNIAVLETGLGGREDATNVVPPPLVCAFSAISLDHTTILGKTVEAITAQKCGIIKPGSTVVTLAQQDPRALSIIAHASQLADNKLIRFDASRARNVVLGPAGISFSYPECHPARFHPTETPQHFPTEFHPAESSERHPAKLCSAEVSGRGLELHIGMPGAHQLQNAALALGVLHALSKRGFPVKPQSIQEGFAQTQLRARIQTVSEKPLVLLDGGHNREGIEALVSVLAQYAQRPKIGIFGMLADKPYAEALRSLSTVLDAVYTVDISGNARSLGAQELARAAASFNLETCAFTSKKAALKAALARTGINGLLVICGSLYLAGEFWPLLGTFLHTTRAVCKPLRR